MEYTVKKVYRTENVPVEFHDVNLKALERGMFPYFHWHDSIEILFFKEGIVENVIDDSTVQETANDVVVINAGTLHSTRAVSETAKYYCLIIDKNLCKQYGFHISQYYLKTEINDIRLFSLVEEIQNEFSICGEHYEAAITAKVLDILTILFREYSSQRLNSTHSKNVEMVKNGIRYIKDNFSKDLTIEDVSKSTGYSKYYFCRCFREITKYTVNSYINKLRVDMAYKLISEKGFSVGDAALECGFDDISYFTKVFKKYTAMLPSQIKRRGETINLSH